MFKLKNIWSLSEFQRITKAHLTRLKETSEGEILTGEWESGNRSPLQSLPRFRREEKRRRPLLGNLLRHHVRNITTNGKRGSRGRTRRIEDMQCLILLHE